MKFRLESFVSNLLVLLTVVFAIDPDYSLCFPENFLFGTATAAYQVEGGWNELGRTPSIWDTFCRQYSNVKCANVADDMLHRYRQDIQLMHRMGLNSFRFSISWSRVMTWDAKHEKMTRNEPGIKYYHELLDELHRYKIEPLLTMYHWDLPAALQEHLTPGGWLNPRIIEHFLDYSKLLYDEYGSKVNFWATFNEPLSFVLGGYENGSQPPKVTNSSTDAYIAAHHVMLAHGYAVELFRRIFPSAEHPKKQISIVLNTDYFFPHNPSLAVDVEAAHRALLFNFGWFLNPIVYGDYPPVMRNMVGDRLPKFTEGEAELLKGSYDLFMLNHYGSHLATDCSSPRSKIHCDQLDIGWRRDLHVDASQKPVGARLSSTTNGELNCKWFSAVPDGYLELIRFLHTYNMSTPILLTENGWCGNRTVENMDQLWYYQQYMERVYEAIEEEIPVIGYTAWSFMDNYEWGGYNASFGLYYVSFKENVGDIDEVTPKEGDNVLQRIPRPAAKWYEQVVKTKCMDGSKSDQKRGPYVPDGNILAIMDL